MSHKRIQKELVELTRNPIPNVSLSESDNLQSWKVMLNGPEGCPYKGGKFTLAIEFTPEYPFKPPKITFVTKVYHPNVDTDGSICLGLLKTEQWKPATKLSDVLSSILNLLVEPNPDDPLIPAIAEQYKTQKSVYTKTAQEWTKQYAK